MPNLSIKPTSGEVGTAIFDLETNGLLNNDNPRIHCVAIHWAEEDLTQIFNDEAYSNTPKDLPMASGHSISTGLSYLEVADTIIGHNIIGFDIPYIRNVYNWFNPNATIIDTLVLSRLYHPNLFDIDKSKEWSGMPVNLYGRHSLEAWGYRLGLNKGDFAKETDWKEWSPEMEQYCINDVNVTLKLCDHFRPYLTGSR